MYKRQDFTPKEYRTLFLFVKNPRIILTKRQILEKLWDIDGDFVDEHTPVSYTHLCWIISVCLTRVTDLEVYHC